MSGCEFLINPLPAALQISGAILLAFSVFNPKRDAIVRRVYFSGVLIRESDGVTLSYNTDAIKKAFKETYSAIIAIVLIGVSYILQFLLPLSTSNASMAISCIIEVVSIVFISSACASFIAEKSDCTIDDDVLEKSGVKEGVTVLTNGEIDDLWDNA